MKVQGVLRKFSNDAGRTFAWVFVVLSIIFIFTFTKPGLLIGSALFLGSFFMVTAYDGLQVDTEKRKYRNTISFWKMITTGTWKPFPANVSKILLFHTTQDASVSMGYVASVSGHRRAYAVRIDFEGHKPIVLGIYRNKEKALKVAERLAIDFQVEMEERLPKK